MADRLTDAEIEEIEERAKLVVHDLQHSDCMCERHGEHLVWVCPNCKKLPIGDDVDRLIAEVRRLRELIESFAATTATVQKKNTDEWMEYIAISINDLFEKIDDTDRLEYDGYERIVLKESEEL